MAGRTCHSAIILLYNDDIYAQSFISEYWHKRPVMITDYAVIFAKIKIFTMRYGLPKTFDRPISSKDLGLTDEFMLIAQ